MQIGIIQVKVDSLERSKQHWNMRRLSTCDRDRRVTDTVPPTRSQISDIRRARADSILSLRHAGTCTLPPQCHGWATPPPRGTATCEMDVHRQPQGGSSHNRTLPQPRTCTHSKSVQACPFQPTKLPSAPPAPPAGTRPARASIVATFRAPWVGIKTSRSVRTTKEMEFSDRRVGHAGVGH